MTERDAARLAAASTVGMIRSMGIPVLIDSPGLVPFRAATRSICKDEFRASKESVLGLRVGANDGGTTPKRAK
jgi:hypothetical protein